MPFDDSNASAIILILLIDGGYLGIRDFVVLSRVNQATHHYLNPSNQVWWPEVYRSVVKLPKYTIADGDHYSVLRAIGSFIHRRSDIPAPFEARLWEYALYPMSPLLDAVRAMVDRPTLKAMMERTHRLLVINRIVSRAAPEDQDIDISARNTSAGSACLHFFNRGVYKINMLEFTPESIDVAFFISKELIWTEFLVYHQRDTTEFAASPVYLAMVVSMVKSLAPRAHIRLPADIATRIPGAVCFEGASQIEYYGSMSRFEPTKLPTTPNVEVLTLSNFVFMMSTQYAFVGTSLRHISIGQSSTILTFGVFQTVAATLDSLSFSDCNIPYGFHDFPIHWPALTSLTINWCDVPDLQGLPKSLPAIQCFMFTSVREIKSFRGMPQEMPRLETLVVSPRCANSPASLRHFPPRLPMLRELKLDGFNNLISLRGFPHAHQLEFLSMSGTSIVSFDGLSMVSTMNLHSLNLDFCENLVSFITLPPTPRLSYLSARNSGIATLMGMPTMNRLTTLDITNTRITKLDCGGAMPRLQSLFMGNTPVLTFEDAPVFEDLRVLTFQPDMLNPMGRLSFVKFAQSHPDMFYSFASDDRHNDSDSDEDL